MWTLFGFTLDWKLWVAIYCGVGLFTCLVTAFLVGFEDSNGDEELYPWCFLLWPIMLPIMLVIATTMVGKALGQNLRRSLKRK